jgi:hypothetical protein
MATTTIKTKVSAKDVKSILHDLPTILAGKKHDRWDIREIFFGTLAHELYKSIHTSCLIKSKGGADSTGQWKPLSARTIKNRLNKKLSKRFPLSNQLMINRVSDKLLETLAPGEFDGTRYKPKRNQKYHHARGVLTLGSKLTYSSYVHQRRELWPEDISEWFEPALELATARVVQRLKEVLQ